MAQSSQEIKSRIASVDSTKKITKAMQLVASSKLTKQRAALDANRPYTQSIKDLLATLVKSTGSKSKYMKENEGKPSYVFMITSDMGLCGGYNANIFRLAQQELKPDDIVVMIGSRGNAWAKNRDLALEDTLIDLNNDTAYMELSKKMDDALDLFEKGEIKDIKVLSTNYKNTLTFVPQTDVILPVSIPEEGAENKGKAVTLYEPGEEAMVESIVPLAVKNELYNKFLESKTSEQASRRMAMESATDNAEELSDQLELAYNRIRQAAITQEITEIVGGANALK